MPSTPLNRYAIVAAAGSSVSTLTRIEIVDSGAPTWRRKLEGISFCSAMLRPYHQRPRSRRATKQRDEVAFLQPIEVHPLFERLIFPRLTR
jgi:hypothetical protein